MSEIVTLELPDTIAHHAKTIAERTGRSLEVILTEWLERGESLENIVPLAVGTEYPIFTPYGNEAAAEVMYQALQAAEAKDRDNKA